MPDAARPIPASPEPAAVARFARRLSLLWFAIFAAALAVAIYAALERRALHADGANYLLRLLELERFDLAEPARRAAMVLLQAPTLLAIRLGWVDLAGAGLVFCLTLELLPLLLLALCYAALPAERKHFFYFPLLHYLAGTLTASASPIAEAIVAAAYFWLLFYIVLFRPLRGAGFAGAVVLALPALYLHEAMGGLALALASAAVWRAGEAGPFWRRAAFAGLALWFAAVAAVQAFNIVVPNSVANRGDLLAGLFGGWWLLGREGEINVPAWLGLFALLAVNTAGATRAPGGHEGQGARWIAAAFAVLAAAGIALAALATTRVAPGQQFGARVNPALLSFLLAAGALGSLWRPARLRWWARPATLWVLAPLAGACLAWHAIEVRTWSRYLAIVRGVLAHERGLVAPGAIVARLDARDRIIFRNMSWHWTFPETSLVLAPGGKVSAIIAREHPVPWKTWDLADPDQVPKSRFFDSSPYRAALARPAR